MALPASATAARPALLSIEPVARLAQRSAADPARWSTTSTWEPEQLAELRRRIGQFGKISLGVFGTMSMVTWVSALFGTGILPRPGNLVPLVALAALVGLMRIPSLSARRVLQLDAIVMVVLGMTWAISLVSQPNGMPMEMPFLFVCTGALFFRSFLVPSWFGRSLWIGALTIAPTAVGIAMRHGEYMDRFVPGMGEAAVAFSIVWLVLVAIVSAYASHSIFGLRQQVRAAQSLGRYTLERKLGEGGMGEVYLGRHVLMRRPAAIKVLRPDRISPTAVASFEREVQALASLTHPNTVPVLDYGWSSTGVFYYVMEYLDGKDLARLVEDHGPQPGWRVVHLLRQAAGALAEAHAQGLLHGDIKPANLIVSERGGVPDVLHVLDFGLAGRLGRELEPRGLTGTPGYLAPEAIERSGPLDARSDLYALGAVAYWLLAGVAVFEAASGVELCLRHVAGEVEPPSVRGRVAIEPALEALVLACLARQPEDRPASARALADALDALAAGPCRFDAQAAGAFWAAQRSSRQ